MAAAGFKRAVKHESKLRLALIGPSGSGKTFTGIKLAAGLAAGRGVAVIDTEHGSASKYADLFDFDVLELTNFNPKTYVEAIQSACAAGYGALVIDSLSHAWMGKDGALEQVERAKAKTQSGNSFMAWRDVTPLHNAMVEAILAAPLHVIVTMRAKTEYVVESVTDSHGKNKQVPRKVGLAPIQREGMEYEFDVVGDMTLENSLLVSKTRCPALTGAVIPQPGQEIIDTLTAWLGGVALPPQSLATANNNDNGGEGDRGNDETAKISVYRSELEVARSLGQLEGISKRIAAEGWPKDHLGLRQLRKVYETAKSRLGETPQAEPMASQPPGYAVPTERYPAPAPTRTAPATAPVKDAKRATPASAAAIAPAPKTPAPAPTELEERKSRATFIELEAGVPTLTAKGDWAAVSGDRFVNGVRLLTNGKEPEEMCEIMGVEKLSSAAIARYKLPTNLSTEQIRSAALHLVAEWVEIYPPVETPLEVKRRQEAATIAGGGNSSRNDTPPGWVDTETGEIDEIPFD